MTAVIPPTSRLQSDVEGREHAATATAVAYPPLMGATG
jgi:hypothetical protein